MNKKTKKRMLILSFVFLALWATATWASNDVLKVQSILGTAIQDIQKIYFSSWAVKDPAHPETEILMNLQNGSVHMWGRMMMAISWANDRMGKLSTWSSLFQGRNNTLSWANSFLVWWSWNTIEQDATWSAILWGTSNKIIKGIASYILWGNKNTISGDNSFIIGGVNNKIEWNNSYIFGFTGVKINANNSVAFWKNIEIEKDNVFMWNGTTNKESASRENTFVMYAKNWLIIKDASNITVTKNNSTWALNVADWIMQISWEAVHCWPAVEGAIQYTWWAFGCFCGCNGTGWVSMTPTQKCRNLCPTIDGFSWDGALCKYSEYDERDSLTKAEACEAWNSSDIQEVTSSYFWEDYVSGWQWTCEDSLWGDTVSCSTKRKLVKGRCWSTLNSCAWEWVLDTTSIRFVNHKNIRECLPVWYPVYWVEGWWETNTKQICSLCEDGYKNLKDASGNRIKDSDWSIKCFKIEGTSCKNDVTITTDWNVWCTSWGVAKSTSTDAYWNKTWDCESPTGSLWEKFCHTCNASANYVWSPSANKCVLKKDWVCANTWASTFAVNNQSTWCITAWWITWYVHDWNTYKWYCKWENGWNNSPLCNYCANGTVWSGTTQSCVSKVNNWTVTFNANGWTWVTASSVSVPNNTVLNLSNYTWYKLWFNFVWWNRSSTAKVAMSNPTVTWNITLYAIFEEDSPYDGVWKCIDEDDLIEGGSCNQISKDLFCNNLLQDMDYCYAFALWVYTLRTWIPACSACFRSQPAHCKNLKPWEPMPADCSVPYVGDADCSSITSPSLCNKTYRCGWIHPLLSHGDSDVICVDPVTWEELSELDCDPDDIPDDCGGAVSPKTPTWSSNCTFKGNTYSNDATIDVFLVSSVQCTSTTSSCSQTTVKCKDGAWYNGINVVSSSKMYTSCSLTSYTPDWYTSTSCGSCWASSTKTWYRPNSAGTACEAINVYKCNTSCGSSWGWWGWGCFLAWTKVRTDKWLKNIEEIDTWDVVLSYNTKTNQNEYNRVLEKLVHEDNSDDVYTLTIDWNVLDVTALHKFYLVGNIYDNKCSTPIWRSAIRLREWDVLRMVDWTESVIENIQYRQNLGTVYNLQVENNHNYFVDKWYLVHNSVSMAQKAVADDRLMDGGGGCGPYTVVDTLPLSTSHCNSCDGSCDTTYY